MAVNYKRYLAENVLNERRVVTYRLLSRALKVHSNLAKQMLYDFQQNENGKKANNVFATYFISGVQLPRKKSSANRASGGGEDVVMRSSPFMSSMPQPEEMEPPIRTTSCILAREEDLEDAKATFQSISILHIYSLQPNALQDFNVLVDVSREILTSFGSEDPLELGKHWGMIQNDRVRRRKTTKPPLSTIVSAQIKAEITKKDAVQPKAEAGISSNESSQQKVQTKSNEKAPSRAKKGNLFSSFANAKVKLKKEDSTASSIKSASEDTQQKGMFDEDDDDGEAVGEDPFSESGQQKSTSTRDSRKEREAKLKQMMEDDDDEDMPDASETPIESATEDSQQLEAQKESEPEPEPEPKEEVTIQGGRRRGKRKIMKKKTIKDDEGYLVTVEEPAWESFSEDEPAPPPRKKAAVSTTGKKPGQGNIMSFFSKK